MNTSPTIKYWKSLALISVLLIVGISGESQASELKIIISDRFAGATEIIQGDYAEGETKSAAALRLNMLGGEFKHTRALLMSNLCMAQFMQKKSAAIQTCDNAVDLAINAHPSRLVKRGALKRALATALSNRGVVKVIAGDYSGARNDFDAALQANPDLHKAQGNLAALARYAPESKVASSYSPEESAKSN